MRVSALFFLILILTIGVTARAGTMGASSKSLYSKEVSASSDLGQGQSEEQSGQGRLARVTAYWPGEDYYTNRRLSATGVRLRDGFCAVDSSIIPYGSVVTIPGLGDYLAMDTGTAVISRKAGSFSRSSGRSLRWWLGVAEGWEAVASRQVSSKKTYKYAKIPNER
jgi:3D (Asp-Asp-Asp) domain-containing protein